MRTYFYIPPTGRMMVFIDGENLTLRYEDMLRDGRSQRPEIRRRPGVYAWNDNWPVEHYQNLIVRTLYYTSCFGSDELIDTVKEEISAFHLPAHPHNPYTPPGAVRSHSGMKAVVFKKQSKNRSSKGVDIQMTVDIIANCYSDNFDAMYIITGDGDFVPVIEEVVRRGKKVFVASLSSGVSPRLKFAGDYYFDLDSTFFEPSSVE